MKEMQGLCTGDAKDYTGDAKDHTWYPKDHTVYAKDHTEGWCKKFGQHNSMYGRCRANDSASRTNTQEG